MLLQQKKNRKFDRRASDLMTINEENIPLVVRSLPALTSNSLGEPMLRRPTATPPTPVKEGGELFNMIAKGRELKPFSFLNDPRRTLSFYDEHYPLLCHKISMGSSSHEVPAPASSVNVIQTHVEPLRPSSADKRTKAIFDKLAELETRLKNEETEVENDPDMDVMVTELRHPVFDPTMWSWNRRRYSLTKPKSKSKSKSKSTSKSKGEKKVSRVKSSAWFIGSCP